MSIEIPKLASFVGNAPITKMCMNHLKLQINREWALITTNNCKDINYTAFVGKETESEFKKRLKIVVYESYSSKASDSYFICLLINVLPQMKQMIDHQMWLEKLYHVF